MITRRQWLWDNTIRQRIFEGYKLLWLKSNPWKLIASVVYNCLSLCVRMVKSTKILFQGNNKSKPISEIYKGSLRLSVYVWSIDSRKKLQSVIAALWRACLQVFLYPLRVCITPSYIKDVLPYLFNISNGLHHQSFKLNVLAFV